MAHELCLAFRTPRSSRRHQIHRRCSRCDVTQTTPFAGNHRSRHISQHPSVENNAKSQGGTPRPSGCGSASGTSSIPAISTKQGNSGKFDGHRRAHSTGGVARAPSSPYCVIRHRVDADVIEFHENGKLLDHHETATTLSSLSRCSTQDKLTASCAFGLPTMR